MAAKKKCVLIGLLGTNLDRGHGPERWETWRPSVSLCQQDDLLLHRFELITQQKFTKVAEIVGSEEVYGALLDFA